jgi:CrcB protein
MWLYFLIGLGGALGSVARFVLSGLIANGQGPGFPWGTLFVNVTGSFAIGFVAALSGPETGVLASRTTRHFLMTGILGGYTTFSAFSLQTLNLAEEGKWLHAGGNVVLSVVACLLAVWLGHTAAGALNAVKGS